MEIVMWQIHSILVFGKRKEYEVNDIDIPLLISFLYLVTTNNIEMEWNNKQFILHSSSVCARAVCACNVGNMCVYVQCVHMKWK